MSKQTKLTVLAVALGLTLTVPGAALADGHDDAKTCSNESLRGLYLFSASGFNIVAGTPQPKAVVEYIRFNGDGTLTVPAATASINGVITRSPPGGTGTYAVSPDCTGSLQFGPPGPAFDLFTTSKGGDLVMIQTGPGAPVMQGTADRLSR
jgi:hypothetical protein